jgi:hypothetical protein
MERRLYFTFPRPAQARQVVDELVASGIARSAVHVVAHDAAGVDDLPAATPAQRHDRVWTLERLYWNANLVVFFVSLLGLLVAVYLAKPAVAVAALIVMAASFLTGERFAVRVPHAHLDEQRVPLQHGEVVVMVDVPADRVHEVEAMVSRRHPEVGVGGVGWHIHGLNA